MLQMPASLNEANAYLKQIAQCNTKTSPCFFVAIAFRMESPTETYAVAHLRAFFCPSQIPWITHGDVVLGDSTFIIDYLKHTYKGTLKIREPETPQQKAVNNSCLHICEGNLVFGIPYFRFLNQNVRHPACMCVAAHQFCDGTLVYQPGGCEFFQL
eukprot:evm.model.scf_86.6 EVM.evm.TU.scf_86.6   scf_86:52897-53364(+)